MFYLSAAIVFTVSLWLFYPPNYSFTFIKVIRIEDQRQQPTTNLEQTETDMEKLLKEEELPPSLDSVLESVNEVFHDIETGDDN